MVEAAQEYFWGVELSKDQPTYTWTFEEEDEDDDYMIHTLFLKNAVLGTSAVKGERNIVQIETKNFDKKELKHPLLSLTLGQSDMCNLDISFGNEIQATFRLVEGEGPIALSGQQLVDELNSQDESALEDTMESELTEEDMSPKKSKKRKAAAGADKKSKKGKMEESMSSADDSMDDDEDEDDDDEDEDEEDMDDEEDEESSPEKGGKKGKKTTKGKGIKVKQLTITLKEGKKRRIVKAIRRKSRS